MIFYFKVGKFNVRLRYREPDWNYGRFVVAGWHYVLIGFSSASCRVRLPGIGFDIQHSTRAGGRCEY